uniref:Uncharacterized protein n=1 Tax=Oryza punctata TaxID=4537 RepID=A0A0E0KCE3_ORYPU
MAQARRAGGQRRCPWRWRQHGEKEDSEEEGKQGQGRRKVLTLWQPCSGTPRVADGVDDRLLDRSIDGTAAYPSLYPTEAQHKPAATEQTERW